MKAILLSVRQEPALNIMNGTKTRELRKTIPHGFVGWVYVYVTKAKRYGDIFVRWSDEILRNYKGTPKYEILGYEAIGGDNTLLNGRVVARFWFDEHEIIEWWMSDVECPVNDEENVIIENYLKKSYLTKTELNAYGKGKPLYAWHIKRLEIFDKPMELKDFMFDAKVWNQAYHAFEEVPRELHRAPQSWQYVGVKE